MACITYISQNEVNGNKQYAYTIIQSYYFVGMEVTVIGNSDVGKVAKPCFGLFFWIVFVEAFLSLLFVLVGFSFWFVSFCLFEGFFFLFCLETTITALPVSGGVFLGTQENFCEHHETSQASTGRIGMKRSAYK